MQCAKCGFQNPDEQKECQHCGINLAWAAEHITEKCPVCGTDNPVLAAKCSNCSLDLVRERQERTAREEQQKGEAEAQQKGRSMADKALTAAILGVFTCGVILEPLAIYQARKAKALLGGEDKAYKKANAAEITGWIALALWALVLIGSLLSQYQ